MPFSKTTAYPNQPAGSVVPVGAAESYDGRFHIIDQKLFLIWDVWAPGFFRQKLDHCAYMVIRDGKFVEEHCREGVNMGEIKPLVDLTKTFKPRLDAVSTNVVSNLTSNNPELGKFDGWRIDMAHGLWATSEDYPDESKLINWIPEDNAENMYGYMTTQLGRKDRAIKELEDYLLQARKRVRELENNIANAATEERIRGEVARES